VTAVVLAQQQRTPARAAGPWRYWTAQHIADATTCPLEAVRDNWPLIWAELQVRDIDDRAVCAAAVATCAIETASTFAPVLEAYWMPEAWRQANLRYWPFVGRGYIQLTWQSNYLIYGKVVGEDLVSSPDLALEPGNAAVIFAEFLLRSGAADAAREQDWSEVRRLVQGGDAGLSRLRAIVQALGVPG
jgi:hypothetical protein